jgi:hypothetical protein
MKELSAIDLLLAFEQDIKMALYALDRYNIDANLALVACDDYDVDKSNLMAGIRQSDIAKKINDHYVAVLFTFVDHSGARCGLEKVLNRYAQYNLNASLIMFKKGETISSVCERILEGNRIVHQNNEIEIYYEG